MSRSPVTGPPPSRWKVVERGRRLEVIDTLAEPTRPAARGTAPRPGLPRQLRFDGTLGWTTHPSYDDRGPRAVMLDGGLARWIGGMVAAMVAVVAGIVVLAGLSGAAIVVMAAVFAGSNRKQVRAWITRRLDAMAT